MVGTRNGTVQRYEIVRKMFNDGATDEEIAGSIDRTVSGVKWIRAKLGLRHSDTGGRPLGKVRVADDGETVSREPRKNVPKLPYEPIDYNQRRDDAKIDEWIAKNGVRRFEAGQLMDMVIETFANRGIEVMRATHNQWWLKRSRGRARKRRIAEVIAEANEYRKEDGLPPFSL